MADLTEEEKIVIGVCTAVAGLILLGIIIFVCCIMYRRHRYGDSYHRGRKDRYYTKDRSFDDLGKDRSYDDWGKERVIYDDRYQSDWGNNDRFYYGGGEVREIRKYPPPSDPLPLPLPPPPPPAPKTRWDLYNGYREQEPEPIYISAPKTYNYQTYLEEASESAPIVIPAAEPDYRSTVEVPEPDTIYLKLRDDAAFTYAPSTNVQTQQVVRYRDDQALLYVQPRRYVQRVHGAGAGGGGGAGRRAIRRVRSFEEIRPKCKFVGEWGHPVCPPFAMRFNKQAARAGKDPFLWQ